MRKYLCPEVEDMRPTNDPIKHCRSHIERTRAALQRREALGRDTYDLRRHLKTLEALLAVHKAARDAAPAPPSSKPLLTTGRAVHDPQ